MDEGEIIFSDHALRQLSERRISKELVKRTVQSPAKLIVREESFEAYRRFGKLWLKAVFVRVEGRVIIVTQHFVKKLP